MNLTNEETSYLAKCLIKDAQSVTYHLFSRDLNIHVNRAKILLLEFYKTHRDKVSAAFIVSGVVSLSGESLIKYCNDENAMDKAASTLFSTIHSIFVYGLVPNGIADSGYGPDEFANVEARIVLSVQDRKNYYKCGMFEPSVDITIGQSLVEPIRPMSPKRVVVAKQKVESNSPLKPVKSSGLTSGYVSRKPKPMDLSIKFPTGTSNKRPAPEEKPPTKYQYKSRKAEPQRERVIVSNSVEDDTVENEALKHDATKSRQQAAELEKMFDQDFSALEGEDADAAEPIAVVQDEKTEPITVDQDNTAEPLDAPPETASSKTGAINGFFAATDKPEDPGSLFVHEEQEETEEVIDEDGFITLYSSRKMGLPAKKAHGAKAKPTAVKVGKASNPTKKPTGALKQGNLMSFFGK